MPKITGWLKTVISLGILVAVAFVGWDYLENANFEALWQTKPVPEWLLYATIVELVNRFLFALAWILLLSDLSPRGSLRLRKLLHIFAQSWIARYLPGSGTWMVARVVLAHDAGLRGRDLAVSTASEAVVQVAVLSLVGSVVLGTGVTIPASIEFSQWGLWVIALLAASLLHPSIVKSGSRAISRLLRRPNIAVTKAISTSAILQVALVFLATSALSACGVLFTTLAFAPQVGAQWLQVVLVAVLASLASILAFFAPAGLGVREAILIFGLAPITGGSTAVLVAFLHRGLSLAWDLVFLLVARVVGLSRR